jgi:uncharacterized DUF497 family protein
LANTVPDNEDSQRWFTVGEVDGKLLVVIHTDAEETNGETEVRIRIISARLATKREARDYRG